MAFDKGNPKVTLADQFISGKSAHQLLALIATGQLPEGLTPAQVGQADIDRTARKAATAAERAA